MVIKIGEFRTTKKIRSYVKDILDSGNITEGKYVSAFEKRLATYLGVDSAIAVTNGTVSLELIGNYLMRTYGPLYVCIPALTYPATANAFINTGHHVILCDVSDGNDGYIFQMDIDTLDEKTKEDIDVIVPVHLMGYPCYMERIMAEAKKYKWIVVEDVAEAFGTIYHDKKVGTFGDFASFSFYVSHNITGGELGAVVAKRKKDSEILRIMKRHGRTTNNPLEFKHYYVGSNNKTTEFCAAIALSQLEEADSILEKRFKNAEYLHDNAGYNHGYPCPIYKGVSFLGFPIQCDTKAKRNKLAEEFKKQGIETRNMFPCLTNQKAYRFIFSGSYPVAKHLQDTALYVGVHQYLSKEDLKKMARVI